MSTNTDSSNVPFIESPAFVTYISYFLFSCIVLLGFLYTLTGDPTLLSDVKTGIYILIIPELSGLFWIYLVKLKREASEAMEREAMDTYLEEENSREARGNREAANAEFLKRQEEKRLEARARQAKR